MKTEKKPGGLQRRGYRLRLVILFSGRGSNMLAVLRACEHERFPAHAVLIVSDNPTAGGLKFAGRFGVPCRIVDKSLFSTRKEFFAELLDWVRSAEPDLVILAGFTQLLPAAFVDSFQGRILNIHPSLLPRFKGLDTHRKVLENGAATHGCTVHVVTKALDAGPLVIQSCIAVNGGESETTLAARILACEHHIFPQAIKQYCDLIQKFR